MSALDGWLIHNNILYRRAACITGMSRVIGMVGGGGARTTHHFHTRRDVALHALTDRIYRHSSSVISLFVCIQVLMVEAHRRRPPNAMGARMVHLLGLRVVVSPVGISIQVPRPI